MLIATVLAVNLFVIGLLIYMLEVAKDRREYEIRAAAENVALLLDVSVTEAVGKVDLALRATVDELQVALNKDGRLGDETNVSLAAKQQWFAAPGVTFRVTDASGKVRYCNGCTVSGEDDVAQQYFFSEHLRHDNGGLIADGVAMHEPSKQWGVAFSRRYVFPDERFAGVVSAFVPIEAFGQILAGTKLGPGGTALLRDANLALISRFPPAEGTVQQTGNQVYSKELADIVASKMVAQTYHTLQSGDGVERILAYRRLAQVPFHVVAGLATEDYLAEWRDQINKAVAAAAFFFLASTAFAWLLWRSARIAAMSNEGRRLLMLNASDGIHIVDVQRRLIEVSDAFCSMLGYTRAEMLGMHIGEWDLDYAAGRRMGCDKHAEESAATATFEAQHRRKDGSTLEVEVTARLVQFAGQHMFFCSARDITERKHAAQALVESEAKFRKFFEENGSVMLIIEPFSGLISAANQAAATYYGFAPDQLVGMNVNQLNTLTEKALAVQRKSALHKERHYFEGQHRLASGEERDVEIYAGPVDIAGESMLFCIVHDVSQRKAVEVKNLRLSRLYAALSQCNQAIVQCVNEAELFPKICACVVEYGFVKMAWIGFVEEASQRVKPVACYGEGLTKEFLDQVPMTVDVHDRHGRGLTGTAIRENQPQWTQDFLNDPVTAPWHAFGEQAGWRSSATMPLCRGGVSVGGLVMYSDTVNAFDEDVRKLLIEVAMTISFALDNFAVEAERRRSAKALQFSEQRYRLAFQTSLDAIAINRLSDGVYVDVNDSIVELFGFQHEEVIGRSALSLGIWVDPEERHALTERLKKGLECRNVEIQFRKKGGEIRWGLMSASLIALEGVPHILSISRDISELKVAEREIKKLAFFDSLTQLANRRLLTDRLRNAVMVSANSQHHCALLFVDLDNFKMLNDSSGHTMGDLLLQEVARRLTTSVRSTDTVARFGGDEFVVLLEHLSDDREVAQRQVEKVGEAILEDIRRPYLLADRECRSTASVGATLIGGPQDGTEALLMQADIAMYRAKAAGRNTLCFFSPELQAAIHSRAVLEGDLHNAITQGQFELYYQPQMDSGGLVGAEALIRWNHPAHGVVAPGRFISVAEETGLILPIGLWVLETACRQLARWGTREDTAHLMLAVNVSALQFRQTDFVAQTLATLEQTGASPQNLKLEIVESMLMDNVEDIIEKMTALRVRGVRFSLDDFGTGYSSLSYLKRLPLDQLKIDWSFVKDVLTDTNDAAIAQTIVALGKTMGLSVIAEGVETEAQKDFLTTIGCHAYQGYLFGKPMSLEAFEQLLKSARSNAS